MTIATAGRHQIVGDRKKLPDWIRGMDINKIPFMFRYIKISNDYRKIYAL